MKWYLLILALMSYPIVELSRLIYEYYFHYQPDTVLIFEFALMWLGFLAGMTLIAWRLRRQ